MNELIERALDLGATDARIIDTRDIAVDDALAALCKTPRCENYGLSAHCPPHVSGPEGLREWGQEYGHAIVFKIDVPAESLMSDQRLEIFGLLQQIAAKLEKSAVGHGYKAKAFAGGSCKEIFCGNHGTCNVLDGRECRNPEYARPSMSGFGINVSGLMDLAGWKMEWNTEENRAKIGTVCGLVLVGG